MCGIATVIRLLLRCALKPRAVGVVGRGNPFPAAWVVKSLWLSQCAIPVMMDHKIQNSVALECHG